MLDLLHLLYFLLGTVGAILTLYLARQVMIPKFRPLVSIEPIENSAQQAREDIAKTKIRLEKFQAMMTDQPLNSCLTRVFNALERSLRHQEIRLDRYENQVLVHQYVSSVLGFLFFVVLGGAFAFLFTGQVKVSLQGPNGGSLPESVQAVAIGAGWTGLVSIVGIRGIQSTATSIIGQMGEQSKKHIDELKKSLVEGIRPDQPVGAPAAVPTPDQLAQLASLIVAQCDQAKNDLSAHLDKARESIGHIM